jgi:hypothetical protein
MFKKFRKSAFFSSFFLPMDPDPQSHRIRIHNPALMCTGIDILEVDKMSIDAT